MRVAAKIATGSGLMLVVLLAAVIYDLALLRRLAETHQELSEVELTATTISLEQTRLLAQIDEFSRKLFVTRDPGYAERLDELTHAFDAEQARLGQLELSPAVRDEAEAVGRLWSRFTANLGELSPAGAPAADTVERLTRQLERVRLAAARLTDVAQSEIGARVAASGQTTRRAVAISWGIVGLAVLLCAPVLWLTIRSINEPLRRLTEGTRAVAGGEFSYQLDASRGDEFAELARSFNEMVERLDELDGMKRDLLSHLSHELRTPLVAMQETNELLLEEIPGRLSDKQRRFLELNLEGSRRLEGMITKLLDLARLDRGSVAYDFRARDLGGLIETATGQLEALAREAGAHIETEPPAERLTVNGDGDRILQVLHNLVENAIKYGPEGAPVTVRWDIPDHAPGNARVRVLDRGPGVAEEERERIFERFHQVRATPPRAGRRGVGLGLAICREIVEAHGGRVWSEAREGGGSVFSVLLPLAEGAAGEGDAGRPEARGSVGRAGGEEEALEATTSSGAAPAGRDNADREAGDGARVAVQADPEAGGEDEPAEATAS